MTRASVALPLLLAALAFGAGCSKPDAPPPAAETVALKWQAAKAYVFDLSLTSTTVLTGMPASSPLVLTARAEVSVGGTPDAPQLLIALVSPRLSDSAGQPGKDSQAIVAELEKPYAIQLSRGIISAYLEPPAQGASVAGFRRHIAAALQLGEHAPAPTWKGTEWDATGLAKVEYRAKPGGETRWDFSKLGYERVVLNETRRAQGMDTRKVAPKIESATGELELDSSGLVRVARSERLSVPLSGNTNLVSTAVLELKRTGFANPVLGDDWKARLRGTQRAEAGSPAPVFDQALTDKARIGSHTFPEVVDKLKELDAKKSVERPSATETGPLFHALVGILRQQPKTIDTATEIIRSRAPVSETLLDGLAMASTTESLAALGQIALDKKLPNALRGRAAASLIRAQQPNIAALELVAKFIEDPLLREQGLYGTGSFVRQLREQGHGAADAGAQLLLRQLERAKAPGELSTVLLAISNSGSAELLPSVVKYQNHANPLVRRAAIQAVRLMPQAEAEERLREVLGRNDRGDVEAALHALGRRPQATRDSVDRVEQLAKSDPSADVRREAVLVLGLWSQLYPALVPVLAQIRERDSDARVREVAKPVVAQ